jgi:hypothetical protein
VGGEGNHHLVVGHLAYYESFNPYLDDFIRQLQGKTQKEIRSMPQFQKAVKLRPKPPDQMTHKKIEQLRRMVDHELPKI